MNGIFSLSKMQQYFSVKTAGILIALVALTGFAAVSLSSAAPAAADDILGGVQSGVCLDQPPSFVEGAASGTTECVEEDSSEGLRAVIRTTLNVLTWIVGVAAVVVLIIAGFRYVVSGGSSSGVTGAKNMIVYALVGVVIALLAQVIVRFVVGNVKESVETARTTCIVTSQQATDGIACQPPAPADGTAGKTIDCGATSPPPAGATCRWVVPTPEQ